MIANRIYLSFDQMRRAAYITPTSLVKAKRRAYQESQSTRHLDDVASGVRLQGVELDREQIDIAAARAGLLGVWRSLWTENQSP